MATATTTSSPTPTNPGQKIILVPPSASNWANWTPAQRNGVIAASVLAGLFLLGVMVAVCYVHRQRRKEARRLESGPVLLAPRQKRRSRSKGSRRRRGIEGLEGVELGPAAARSLVESGGLGLSREGVGRGGDAGEGRGRGRGEYEMSGGLQGRECGPSSKRGGADAGSGREGRVGKGLRPLLPPNQAESGRVRLDREARREAWPGDR
ncbi:hypothetical protein MMC28_009328 [Mycoblastus sanguinarius]|nr:hypothetical protein [Mycoblastus sanguinarius]